MQPLLLGYESAMQFVVTTTSSAQLSRFEFGDEGVGASETGAARAREEKEDKRSATDREMRYIMATRKIPVLSIGRNSLQDEMVET